ncbi:plasmid maintenance system antidote protein [Mucilaginibacter sp. UR6-1]|uniref:helix-turn-helix transcriptional regulator n=1 Tax=Mucilaginibacter sp. UR6-1 TaxID=1435643 RepID=UPI001E5BD72C|nr:plasmid maintenance system antidote protein [Mucilaginibacter sp. UR6-1]MCC8408631.1 plasmid maintenance system antidote protein [Mucilaginibacter sp. UR6-1]
MQNTFESYYGIHPGRVLERELKKRHLKKGPFAISVGEYPQVINEVTKARRGLSPMLSLKIDQALGLENGAFYLLQAHYDIDQAQKKLNKQEAPAFRKELFWDTDMKKIDWSKQYKAVIQRVFERGNEDEKQAALDYYGSDKILEVTGRDNIDGISLKIMAHTQT